jgi:hypothetical protein
LKLAATFLAHCSGPDKAAGGLESVSPGVTGME